MKNNNHIKTLKITFGKNMNYWKSHIKKLKETTLPRKNLLKIMLHTTRGHNIKKHLQIIN